MEQFLTLRLNQFDSLELYRVNPEIQLHPEVILWRLFVSTSANPKHYFSLPHLPTFFLANWRGVFSKLLHVSSTCMLFASHYQKYSTISSAAGSLGCPYRRIHRSCYGKTTQFSFCNGVCGRIDSTFNCFPK